MNDFGVLNSRKRALVALIHSVIFLGIAGRGFASPKAGIFHGQIATADLALIAIYLTVASVLVWLVSLSRCLRERVYFAFCASSATFGLLRTILGDAAIPPAQYLRVIMLSSAVIVGASIVRSHSQQVSQPVISE